MSVKCNVIKKIVICGILLLFSLFFVQAQVDTGGPNSTKDHSKQVIGYITQWDAWKAANAGLPAQGALTQLNIDYSKYTILNYSFFGIAVDGSLHSGDFRDKQIYKDGVNQQPNDMLYTDIYSSWDLYILFGELEPVQYISQAVYDRAIAQGFDVKLNGTTWSNPSWGIYNRPLPLPLKKEGGAPGLFDAAKANGVKVMASIGGWSMCKHYFEMAADPVKRQRFLDDCVTLMNMGFDGIDLDWEYPGPYSGMNFTGTEEDFENFAVLVEEIRKAIGPDKLITSCFSAAPNKLDGFDWPRISSTLDYMNMMTYDMNGGWSNKAGHNAPLYPYPDSEAPDFSWKSCLDTLKGLGVNLSKVNFGMPFYGRGVICKDQADLNAETVKRDETVQPDGPISTCADYTNWPRDVYDGTPNYYYIKQKTGLGTLNGWTRHWDDIAKVPYLTKDNFFLSYDDEESIALKSEFINDNGLAGTIIWTVYGDLELSGSYQSFGTKLKRWSQVDSVLVNKINEVFAQVPPGKKPVVSITAPAKDEIFKVTETITVTADATDEDGVVTEVRFYAGTELIGIKTEAPYSVTYNPAAAGIVSLKAVATDNDNLKGESSLVPITIVEDVNLRPTVTYIEPLEGQKFPTTDVVTFTITVTAEDRDGTVEKVEFFNGTTSLGQGTSLGDNYSYEWKNVPIGTYTIKAVATDNLGAVSTGDGITVYVTTLSGCTYPDWSASASYTKGDIVHFNGRHYEALWSVVGAEPGSWKDLGPCTGGNKAPTISITADKTEYNKGETITITADAKDEDGQVVKVEFFRDGTSIGSNSSAPFEIALPDAQPGTYSFTAIATDNEGATGEASPISVTVNEVTVDEWQAGVDYALGDIVTYGGSTWLCKLAHQSNAAWYPGASGLWFWEKQ